MTETSNRRLDSWKEIADYLGRDVRTVVRWEKEKGLPVRRLPGGKRAAVFAYTQEIDDWLNRGQQDEPTLGEPTSQDAVSRAEEEPSLLDRGWLWPALAVGLALLVIAAGGMWSQFHRATQASLAPMRILPLTSNPAAVGGYAAISPDGKYVAYATWFGAGKQTKQPDLYVQIIGAGEPLRLTTQGATYRPAWSPDGRFIAFVRHFTEGNAAIFTVPSLGGMEHRIGDVADGHIGATELSWSPDGRWIAFSDRDSSDGPFHIYFVSPETGEKKPFPGTGNDLSPSFSPDGKMVAYLGKAADSRQQVFVSPVEGGTPKQVTFDAYSKLTAIAWTVDSRELIYCSKHGVSYSLWRIPAEGGVASEIPLGDAHSYAPAIAMQANRLVYVKAEDDANIWRLPLSAPGVPAGPPQRLIYSNRRDSGSVYSPDSRKIVFMSNRSGNDELWVCESDGSNSQRLTSFAGPVVDTMAYSPDGRRIATAVRGEQPASYYVNLDGSPPVPIDTGFSGDTDFIWSADGRWLYFTSGRTGRQEVWKMPAEGGAARQVTSNGGRQPAESPDGKFLYFVGDAGNPGLWRIPLPDGEAALVLKEFDRIGWVPAQSGLYFLNRSTPGPPTIEFLDVASGKRKVLATLEKPVLGLLALSPDGKSLLFTQYDRADYDIMLVDNFH